MAIHNHNPYEAPQTADPMSRRVKLRWHDILGLIVTGVGVLVAAGALILELCVALGVLNFGGDHPFITLLAIAALVGFTLGIREILRNATRTS